MKSMKTLLIHTSALAYSALALACCLLPACGKNKSVAAFSTDWENDRGKSIRAVFEQVHGAKLPVGASLALGVTRSGLVARSLDGKESWSYKHALDSRPTIATDVVVGEGGGSVFCLDAHTGHELWTTSAKGLHLRGAGDDGTYTAVSLGALDVTQNLLLVVNRRGSVVFDTAPKLPIGTPAVLGGIAFVPWGGQYVSAIDIDQGNEAGRLLSRSEVSHAINIGGDLYFGEHGLIRFDEKIADAANDPKRFITLPPRQLPGNPQWMLPGSRVTPAVAAALDKVRFYARPNAGGTGVESTRFAASYFRLAMGFDSTAANLTWVHESNDDYLAAAAARGGFAFCDASGKVSFFGAAAGEDAGSISLGTPLLACVVQASDFTVASNKQPARMFDQLKQAVTLDAPQLVTAQRFLLGEISKINNPDVTEVLIQLASHPRTAPALLEDARTLLAARRDGADFMLDALKSHYDFLANIVTTPPVGPLADALAAMKEQRAASLLADHLNDPADSADDVMRSAKALETLATPAEYSALKIFFTLYRAAASDRALEDAVISVAKALLTVGGDQGHEVVAFASRDKLTQKRVREGIARLLED
ncbi:MAG TPA: PQQ-binding-like beta-propeller repeat protein [Polyangiaceae bacterium]|nr:PQQ-binding-like beta-propeller repeat protein [Polyangiaceae bacterium]